MLDAMRRRMADLRYEPIERRVRATLGDATVVDSVDAALVWEPHRPVPSYAVARADVRAVLTPAPDGGAGVSTAATDADVPPVLHPGIPFSAHSTAGVAYTVRAGDRTLEGAAFAPADADLAGFVVLDFHAFDAWFEEEDPVVAHPRDPFHRVDARPSSRHVRVETGGQLLADTTRPVLVFETYLPTRFYLPREDVLADLRPSARRTRCAYKGEASYWSVDAGADLAWSYEEPLAEMARLKGLVAFFDELVDVTVDGVARERPATPFARAIVEEARG
jgi:uncharacterized protein (DUF427 family)